jgi:putative acetyltransferase
VAEVHACKAGIQVFDHVLGDVTLAIHPDFQGKKVGRTIFTIFLEEVARNRPDVGKVELITRESNHRAIRLYESLGFRIEGRLEMRVRRPDGTLEADIPMGWINPNFDFDILGGQDPV